MTKTHWRKLHNPDYLGSWDLTDSEGKFIELVVQFTSIESKLIKNIDGEKYKAIGYLKQFKKPMIVNIVNSKKIESVLGSECIEDWVGKNLTLYVTKVKSPQGVVDALRFKAAKQTVQPAKEELSPKHPKWDGALAAINSGATTIEAIESKYKLTQETKKLLL